MLLLSLINKTNPIDTFPDEKYRNIVFLKLQSFEKLVAINTHSNETNHD